MQVTNIGKLDIVWRTGLCERGRLQVPGSVFPVVYCLVQTSQLQRLAPGAGEVRLVVVQVGQAPVLNSSELDCRPRVTHC